MEQDELKICPKCGEILKVLLFLGFTPDGYVCDTCHIYYGDDLTPLATIL